LGFAFLVAVGDGEAEAAGDWTALAAPDAKLPEGAEPPLDVEFWHAVAVPATMSTSAIAPTVPDLFRLPP
jgi:hypothetical protein